MKLDEISASNLCPGSAEAALLMGQGQARAQPRSWPYVRISSSKAVGPSAGHVNKVGSVPCKQLMRRSALGLKSSLGLAPLRLQHLHPQQPSILHVILQALQQDGRVMLACPLPSRDPAAAFQAVRVLRCARMMLLQQEGHMPVWQPQVNEAASQPKKEVRQLGLQGPGHSGSQAAQSGTVEPSTHGATAASEPAATANSDTGISQQGSTRAQPWTGQQQQGLLEAPDRHGQMMLYVKKLLAGGLHTDCVPRTQCLCMP